MRKGLNIWNKTNDPGLDAWGFEFIISVEDNKHVLRSCGIDSMAGSNDDIKFQIN